MKQALAILLLLFSPVLAFSKEGLTETGSPRLTEKILFLTNSTFHAHGGSMKPFNGYCENAGIRYEASGSYSYFESTPQGRRISPFIKGQIEDTRILELIAKEQFDYVVLATRFHAFLTDEEASIEIEAFKKMHEHIVRSGARTVVSISYITREQTNDAGIQTRNLEKHEQLKEVLNNTVVDGKKSPIILVPTGVLWAEGIRQFGGDAWFADKVHGTPLAQHASGCLFFTFITGNDPRKNSYVELHVGEKFLKKS